MAAKSRYWDHERCAWVVYEPAPLASPEALAEALPDQRADQESTPATLPAPTASA